MNGRNRKYVAITLLALIELALISFGTQRQKSHALHSIDDFAAVPSATLFTQYHQPTYVESPAWASSGFVYESSPSTDGYLVVEPYVEYPVPHVQSAQPNCQCGPQVVMSFSTPTEYQSTFVHESYVPVQNETIVYESTPMVTHSAPYSDVNGQVVYEPSYATPAISPIYESQPTSAASTSSQQWVMVPTSEMPQYVEQHYPTTNYQAAPTVVESQPIIESQVFVDSTPQYFQSQPYVAPLPYAIDQSASAMDQTPTYVQSSPIIIEQQAPAMTPVGTMQPAPVTIESTAPYESYAQPIIVQSQPTIISTESSSNTFVASPTQQTYTSNLAPIEYSGSTIGYSSPYSSQATATVYYSSGQDASCPCQSEVIYESTPTTSQIVSESAPIASSPADNVASASHEQSISDTANSETVADPVPEIIEAPAAAKAEAGTTTLGKPATAASQPAAPATDAATDATTKESESAEASPASPEVEKTTEVAEKDAFEADSNAASSAPDKPPASPVVAEEASEDASESATGLPIESGQEAAAESSEEAPAESGDSEADSIDDLLEELEGEIDN